MKPSQLIGIIICLSLILISADCTDSTNTPSEKASSQEVQSVEQPTPVPTPEQSISTTQNSITLPARASM